MSTKIVHVFFIFALLKTCMIILFFCYVNSLDLLRLEVGLLILYLLCVNLFCIGNKGESGDVSFSLRYIQVIQYGLTVPSEDKIELTSC